MPVRKIKAGGVNVSVQNFIGEDGILFYDSNTGDLRLSDGHTPGGLPLTTATNIATTSTLGQIKVDGVTITVDQYGVISAPAGAGETDPIFSTSTAAGIASSDVANWNTAYSWGDHAGAGYLTAINWNAVNQDIIPDSDLAYDLGSTSSQWRSLYVGTSTIYLGGTALSVGPGGELLVDGTSVTAGSATTSTLVNGTYTVALSTSGNLVFSDGLSNISTLDPNTSGGIYGLNLTGKDRAYINIVGVNTFQWDFRDFGRSDYGTNKKPALMLPGGSTIEEDLTNESLNYGVAGPLKIESVDRLILTTNRLGEGLTSEENHNWDFSNTGTLTFPSLLKIKSVAPEAPVTGTEIIQESGIISMVAGGDGHFLLSGWAQNYGGPGNVAYTDYNYDSGSVRIVTGNNVGTLHTWKFDDSGVLTLPNNTSTIKTEIFSNFGTDFPSIVLTPDPTFDQGQGLRIYAGFSEAGHLHLTASTSTTDLFLGNDDQFVKVAADGMIELNGNTVRMWGEGEFSNSYLNLPNNNDSDSTPVVLANYGAAGVLIQTGNTSPPYNWEFSSTGTLTLPNATTISDFGGATLLKAVDGISSVSSGSAATSGGGIIIQAGNAGADDGIDPMTGAQGGVLIISGGQGTGDFTGGSVAIFGGPDANGDFADVTIGNGGAQFTFYGNGTLEFSDGTTSTGSTVYVPYDTTSSYDITTVYDQSGGMGGPFLPLTFKVQGDRIVLPNGNGLIVSGDGIWELDTANNQFTFPNSSRFIYGEEGSVVTTGSIRLEVLKTDPGHIDPDFSIILANNFGSYDWHFSNTGTTVLPGPLQFADATIQTTAFRIVTVPVSSTSTGSAGTLAYDSSFFYVCTATNAWQRIAWDNTPW